MYNSQNPLKSTFILLYDTTENGSFKTRNEEAEGSNPFSSFMKHLEKSSKL